MSEQTEREVLEAEMREAIVHNLRTMGWSKIDAEEEADERLERLRAARDAQ